MLNVAEVLPAAERVSTKPVFQIIYGSTAATDFSKLELVTLLRAARRRNTLNGITGALLYHDRTFIQVIEGEEEIARATYARILRDPRHGRSHTFFSHTVEQRSFNGWSMGFRTYNQEETDVEGFISFCQWQIGERVPPPNASAAVHMLHTFRKNLR